MTNETLIKTFLTSDATAHKEHGSLFFEAGVLYSYGYHFPLAWRVDGRLVLNSGCYSVTTSKHQGLVRYLALSTEDQKPLRVPLPAGASDIKNPRHLLDIVLNRLADIHLKGSHPRKVLAEKQELEDAEKYLMACFDRTPVMVEA